MKERWIAEGIETYFLRREPRQCHIQPMEALDATGLARSGVHMSETLDEVITDLLQDHPTPEISLRIRRRSFVLISPLPATFATHLRPLVG